MDMVKVDDNITLTMLGQGNTAEIYQYEENKVLKLFREFMPITPIEIEYKIASMVQNQFQNVPRVYGMVKYRKRLGIVYEQILGKSMIELLQCHPLHIKQYSKQFASIHLSLHKKDIDVQTSVKEKLSRDIDNACELSSKEKEKIKQYLRTLPDGNKLCHFDFHPGNILYRGNCPVIIDWMTACTGNPNADVARTILMMRMGEMIHINPFVRAVLHIATKKIGYEYLKEYMRISGVSEHEVQSWILPVAAARLSECLSEHERKKLIVLVRKELTKITMYSDV